MILSYTVLSLIAKKEVYRGGGKEARRLNPALWSLYPKALKKPNICIWGGHPTQPLFPKYSVFTQSSTEIQGTSTQMLIKG